nr:hypothetical protein [Tanacetum cinerariifolium]
MYTIKECSSCGALYNKPCGCSKGGFIDKFVCDPNKAPDSSQRPPHYCPKCGNPFDRLYYRQCALLQKKLKEVWFTICKENEIFQDFLNTSESSNDNTNVVSASQEPFVFNQNPGKNSSQSPHIDQHCCYGCGDSLDGIFSQRCTGDFCGNGAHIGYNYPPKQANVFLCFENLSEEHANLVYTRKSCKEMKARHKDCKKELEEELKKSEKDAHQLKVNRERLDVKCENGEMVRQRIINEYLPTFICQLHQSVEYKWALGEVFSLAVRKGFIDGISIGRKEEYVQAILAEMPNVDPAVSATFMEKYEKLFNNSIPLRHAFLGVLHWYNKVSIGPYRRRSSAHLPWLSVLGELFYLKSMHILQLPSAFFTKTGLDIQVGESILRFWLTCMTDELSLRTKYPSISAFTMMASSEWSRARTCGNVMGTFIQSSYVIIDFLFWYSAGFSLMGTPTNGGGCGKCNWCFDGGSFGKGDVALCMVHGVLAIKRRVCDPVCNEYFQMDRAEDDHSNVLIVPALMRVSFALRMIFEISIGSLAQALSIPNLFETSFRGLLNCRYYQRTVETASRFLVTPSGYASDGVRSLAMESERNIFKEALEDSAVRRRHGYKATSSRLFFYIYKLRIRVLSVELRRTRKVS